MKPDEQEIRSEEEPFANSTFPSSMDSKLWETLYHTLTPLIKGWIYGARVPTWKGQEYDITNDLVQVTMLRIFRYLEHARQNNIPIYLIEHLSAVIARHCFIDLRRRDIRLLHFAQDEATPGGLPALAFLTDPAQEAEEKIYEEELLQSSARIIATFPPKLRRAILNDLANNTHFDKRPTTLQQAFLDVGIDLRAFKAPQPTDQLARGKQSALRSLAYKRLAQEIARQESGEVEQDIPVIREDTELAALALHLQDTLFLVAASSFQEKLRARLLASEFRSTLQEQDNATTIELSSNDISQLEEKEQEYLLQANEPDIAGILNDQELSRLAECLREAASPVKIDSTFQSDLRAKLVDILRRGHVDSQHIPAL